MPDTKPHRTVQVGGVNVPVYEARPASGANYPIILVISEIWGVHEYIKQHNKDVDIHIYPGAGHGFHADYRPSYAKEAAEDAWKRCTAWFTKYLKA